MASVQCLLTLRCSRLCSSNTHLMSQQLISGAVMHAHLPIERCGAVQHNM